MAMGVADRLLEHLASQAHAEAAADGVVYLDLLLRARTRLHDLELPLLARMQCEVKRTHDRRYAEQQQRFQASRLELAQAEARQREHLVGQRCVALHGVLAAQFRERNAVLARRRRQRQRLEQQFTESVAMAAHDDFGSRESDRKGALPLAARCKLHAVHQEQHRLDVARHAHVLEAAEAVALTNFEAAVADAAEREAQEADAVEQERRLARDADWAARHDSLLTAMAARQRRAEEGHAQGQSALAQLQAALQRRRAQEAEQEAQHISREAVRTEREAQRAERDQQREGAIRTHQKLRQPQEPNSGSKPSVTPEELTRQAAYLTAWRSVGKRVGGKGKGPRPLQVDTSTSLASLLLHTLYTQ